MVYGISSIIFGFLPMFSRYTFIGLGFTLRAIQGFSCAAIFATSYSIFSIIYRGSQLNTVNLFFKSTVGIGNLSGLLAGTFLFMIGGYRLPFIIYGFLFLGMLPIIWKKVPSNLEKFKVENSKRDEERSIKRISDLSDEIDPSRLVSNPNLLQVLFEPSILRLLCLAMFDMTMLNFSPAIMSQRLTDLKVNKELFPLFFAIPFIFPVVSSAIYFKWQNKLKPVLWIILGKLFMGIGFVFTGPSYLISFVYPDDQIVKMLFGLAITGFSLSFNIVPLFPMMMKEIKHRFVMDDTRINDMASSLYTASFGTGCIAGPVLGAYLNWLFGFQFTTTLLSNLIFFVLILMLIFWDSKCLKQPAVALTSPENMRPIEDSDEKENLKDRKEEEKRLEEPMPFDTMQTDDAC